MAQQRPPWFDRLLAMTLVCFILWMTTSKGPEWLVAIGDLVLRLEQADNWGFYPISDLILLVFVWYTLATQKDGARWAETAAELLRWMLSGQRTRRRRAQSAAGPVPAGITTALLVLTWLISASIVERLS